MPPSPTLLDMPSDPPSPICTIETAEAMEIVTAQVVPVTDSAVEIVPAELVPRFGEPSAWRPRSWPVWLWHSAWWSLEQVVGYFCLMIGLAAVATVPVLQFVSLGYLLECSGRIARTGRLRSGFIDLDKWARIGSLIAGSWLMFLPLRQLANLAHDARFVTAEANPSARGLGFLLLVCTALTIGHTLLAWYSGGKLRHFFWPLLAPFSLAHWVLTRKIVGPIVRPVIQAILPKLADDLYQPAPLTSWFPPAILLAGLLRGPRTMYEEARDAVWDFVSSMHLPFYFWLGLRGFAGAMVWLFLPILMLIGSTKIPNDGGAFVIGMTGAFLLGTVLLYLPFLQTHFAAENRFRALFELGKVRAMFHKAPIAFWFALLITLAFALPPYVFKIQKIFDEFDWLFSFFFVFLVYPGRLLAGWAVGLARHREKPRFFLFRWGSRLAALPLCFIYVVVVYLSQYTSWFGSWSLFEQHPFLVPVPFFGG